MRKVSTAAVAGMLIATGLGVEVGLAGPVKAPAVRCSYAPPASVPSHQPFLLNDPRSGLMLYLESDGRHMSAISRRGAIVWHRDLFADPRLERAFPPPPPILGDPPRSAAENRRWLKDVRLLISRLFIDNIAIASDCVKYEIDHHYSSTVFRGHYIELGSGTKISYLLDATNGDFLIEGMN